MDISVYYTTFLVFFLVEVKLDHRCPAAKRAGIYVQHNC